MQLGYNGTADIWIDGQGNLSLKRSNGRIISQRCPYSGSPCGDTCPMFDVEVVGLADGSKLGTVYLCQDHDYEGELQDSRE